MNILKLKVIKESVKKFFEKSIQESVKEFCEKKKLKKDFEKQGCKVWCSCGNELVSTNSCLIDYLGETGFHNIVYFKCKNCNKDNYYNFDIAPMPIPWSSLEEVKEKLYPNGFGFLEDLIKVKENTR